MSRIINIESAGKQRKRLIRSIIIALQGLMKQAEINRETRDLSSYISLGLEAIAETIDPTVEPWEKRGYWVKADRFRLQWEWAHQLSCELEISIKDENWHNVALISAKVAEKFKDIDVPKRHGIGTPWKGAWEELTREKD